MPTSAATAANTSSTTTVTHSARVDSKSAIAITGPSSPQVPYDKTAEPTRVSMTSRSLRIGIKVPSASEISHVTRPRLPCLPVRLFGLISKPASKNRNVRPSSDNRLIESES